MNTITERICLHDVHFTTLPNSSKVLHKGETYSTSQVWEDNTISVFTSGYWLVVDADVFIPEATK